MSTIDRVTKIEYTRWVKWLTKQGFSGPFAGLTPSHECVKRLWAELRKRPPTILETKPRDRRTIVSNLNKYGRKRGQTSVNKSYSSTDKEDQLSLITETVTIQPSHEGFKFAESLEGAKYLDISIPSNDLWIESITITTSHPKAPYKFLIFDRKQPDDFYNAEDMFWEKEYDTRRTQYVQPQPPRYLDADECKHLQCGFEHEGHPRDFRMNDQELKVYFRQPITYTVRLEYKLY